MDAILPGPPAGGKQQLACSPTRPGAPSISLVLPAYNEAEVIVQRHLRGRRGVGHDHQ